MIWRCLWLCLLSLFASKVGATELRLSGTEAMVALAPLVEVYEDKSAAMGIEEIVRQGHFTPQPELLHPGFTPSAIWLKLDLTNTSAAPLTRWLAVQPPRLEEVSLFVRQGGRWQRTDTGTGQPFSRHPVPAANAVLPLQLAPGETLTAYIRIAGQEMIVIAPALWEPRAFREAENVTRLTDGIMLGGLAVTPLFALLMLLTLRDRAFLFHALMTLTFCLGEASNKGYSFMYLWPDATRWATYCLPLFALLGTGLSILFLRDLIATRRNFPRLDRWLLLLLAFRWLPAFGILFGDYRFWAKLSLITTPLVPLALFFVGILAVLKGIHAARYYTASFVVMMIGGLLHLAALNLNSAVQSADYAD